MNRSSSDFGIRYFIVIFQIMGMGGGHVGILVLFYTFQ